MASSGSFTTSAYSNRSLTFSWWIDDTVIEQNYTVIKWELKGSGSQSMWFMSAPFEVIIDNAVVYSSDTRIQLGKDTLVASGYKSIGHQEDGSRYFSASVKATVYVIGAYNVSGSGGWYLDTIPRQATILTAPNFNDGQNPTITYSNPAGDAVTSLEASIYDSLGGEPYAPYRAITKTGSTYTFELTDAERETLKNACANSNSITVGFYVRTKLGGNTYWSYLNRTFSITDANPIVTAEVVDTNEKTIALTGNAKKLIKYHSNAKATITSAVAQKGAAIDEDLYIIRNGNYTGYGTEHTFEEVESNEFTFSVKDSRGNVGTTSVVPNMVNYIKPTCYISNNRPDALGHMTVACSGSFFNDSFGKERNELQVWYRYYESGNLVCNWTEMSVVPTGNSYYASAELDIPDFEEENKQDIYFTFEVQASDKLETVSSTPSNVKSTPIFHWGENDFVFEVPVTFKQGLTNGDGTSAIGLGSDVDGDLHVTGNLRLKGSGNYGNTLLFGDGTYCYITEPEDDVMHIKAKRIDLDANGVYVYGNPIPDIQKGRWSPSLNSSAISSYTTQEGWYSKLGQTVSVGFYIKATCKSGYSSTGISISGLPFTPMFSASGGGMCSGAYVSGGFTFQCFVAETSKSITTRVQSCNHTSQTNLSTSASGCWYPSGGGEITLSGTITFMSTE